MKITVMTRSYIDRYVDVEVPDGIQNDLEAMLEAAEQVAEAPSICANYCSGRRGEWVQNVTEPFQQDLIDENGELLDTVKF